MWEGSAYGKLGAGGKSSKSSQGLLNRGPRFTLKRTEAQIRVTEGFANHSDPIAARVFLHEIGVASVWIFSTKSFLTGQQVSVTIDQPAQLFAKGMITSCRPVSLESHVLAEVAYAYRVSIRLRFASQSDVASMQAYVDELMMKHVFEASA